jgi:hypothetical protein
MSIKTLLLAISFALGACGIDSRDRNDKDPSGEASPTPSAELASKSTTTPEPSPSASSSPSPVEPIPIPGPSASSSPEPIISPSPVTNPEPENALKPTIDSIQANLINKKCISCHQSATEGNGLVDLRDLRENISAFPGRNPQLNGARTTVMSGCPEYSILSLSLKNGTMPPAPAEHISAADLAVVEAWIRSLEPNRAGCTK